ncbi:homocysteine-responsive endoplasmic reticulum-resident ubiquitin-like domain member 2 protein [Chironomus tepperi]|uniref:homocysteine-responsive endoplasmic reticulum-resident ubiquitin-like domain member 2 protein n=1 Tax=Chironomus tepperi TaxID=113505 RepID=UPI00391FB08A
MDTMINLIVKVQQFEDKRILAKASWNIRELKGKLSEIYPTSTEEQKLIYSGKLLNDTVVLKDVLREYEGQEAHTVHLVFTPKTSSRLQSKLKENSQNNSTNQSQSSDMSTSELRQRHTATSAATVQEQQQQATTNIPSNYYNAFYGNMPFDANSVLAQQYAMQSWMQQAYAQYMNQYMNIVQQQQTQPAPNLAGFMQPQMPFISPTIVPTPPTTTTVPSPNTESQSASPPPQPQAQVDQPPQPAAAEPQRRFPNIIQDEQENRDWLDIVYSMSRLLILLCLVYFYSSPLRCLIVILIGISIYLYHIYRQNQNRLNNNNTTRVNLNNVNRPPQAAAPAAPRPENTDERPEQPTEENQQAENSETEPLVNASDESQSIEPQVSWLTIARTFVVSFVASIIPEHPAM